MRSIYLGFLIAGLAPGGCGGSGSQQTWYEECTAKGGKVYLSKGHRCVFGRLEDHRHIGARTLKGHAHNYLK